MMVLSCFHIMFSNRHLFLSNVTIWPSHLLCKHHQHGLFYHLLYLTESTFLMPFVSNWCKLQFIQHLILLRGEFLLFHFFVCILDHFSNCRLCTAFFQKVNIYGMKRLYFFPSYCSFRFVSFEMRKIALLSDVNSIVNIILKWICRHGISRDNLSHQKWWSS